MGNIAFKSLSPSFSKKAKKVVRTLGLRIFFKIHYKLYSKYWVVKNIAGGYGINLKAESRAYLGSKKVESFLWIRVSSNLSISILIKKGSRYSFW